MKKHNPTWFIVMVLTLAFSAIIAGLNQIPDDFHIALFLVSISMAGWMLTCSWKWQKRHATLAWMYFLSSLLTILLITDSITHLSGL